MEQDGGVLDILVQKRKNKEATKRFFRKLLTGQGSAPLDITTDKLRSYRATKREVMPRVPHHQERYANNGVEVSHEYTRARERQMRGVRAVGNTQRFLAVYSQCHNLFRVGRHLLSAKNYRLLRERSFQTCSEVTCA